LPGLLHDGLELAAAAAAVAVVVAVVNEDEQLPSGRQEQDLSPQTPKRERYCITK